MRFDPHFLLWTEKEKGGKKEDLCWHEEIFIRKSILHGKLYLSFGSRLTYYNSDQDEAEQEEVQNYNDGIEKLDRHRNDNPHRYTLRYGGKIRPWTKYVSHYYLIMNLR